MKAIFVLFDSLSRKYLSAYGNDWVRTPNFQALSRRAVTFDNCYVGSMPCMPARRELHTGRYNFLHRSWGPLEPFDDSTPEILAKSGVYTHLISDHLHYWEDGGATYHNRYSSWECVRGQQGDRWKGQVAKPEVPPQYGQVNRHDLVNRRYMQREEDTTQARTFQLAEEFIRTNASQDNWLLHVECFDPHPPFFSPTRFQDLYPHKYNGPLFDYPEYAPLTEDVPAGAVEHCRYLYAALVSYCDYSLGRILHAMDEHRLWDDTMLIVTTDHGFGLGEHNWWCFCRAPFYDEHARKPLFIHDPRTPGAGGQRRRALVQTHDLPATLLEYFGVSRPADMQGRPLAQTVARDAAVREAAMFGVFGGHVNCTDGRYVYMRSPTSAANQPLHEYTLMPTHMLAPFRPQEFAGAELVEPFRFTKGCRPLRLPGKPFMQDAFKEGTRLYDLQSDPLQEQPIQDRQAEERMIRHLVELMRENDAPEDQYLRLGLPV